MICLPELVGFLCHIQEVLEKKSHNVLPSTKDIQYSLKSFIYPNIKYNAFDQKKWQIGKIQWLFIVLFLSKNDISII